MRIYIDPKSLEKRIHREYLLRSCKYGAEIRINIYGEKKVRNRIYILASISIECDEGVVKALRKLGLKFSKGEKKALFNPSVLVHLDRKQGNEGIPLGVSRRGDRVITVPWPSRILTNDPIYALIISLFSQDALWIDYLGLDNYALVLFREVEGVPISVLSHGAVEELARLIARKTIGEKYYAEISKYLMEGENMLSSDEELPIMGPEQNALMELLKWRIINLEPLESVERLYVDLVGSSRFSFIIASYAALLSNLETTILSSPRFDKELRDVIMRRDGVVYVSPNLEKMDRKLFDVIINGDEKTIEFRSRNDILSKYNYIEDYKGLDELVREVMRQ